MDANEAINRLLLSQDTFKEVKSKRDKKEESNDMLSQGVDSSIQNPEFTNGGGNKLNSDETSNVEGTRNHLDGLSTTSDIHCPSNSELTNGETKRVPISSRGAVPSLSVPSSRHRSSRGRGISGQRTMADVVKMGLGSSKESVTKAPVKDDSPLHEKPGVTYPFSESQAARIERLPLTGLVPNHIMLERLPLPDSISNQSLRGGNVTYPFSESQAARIERLPLTGLVPNHIMLERLPLPDSISNQSLRDDNVTYPFSESQAARINQLPLTGLVPNHIMLERLPLPDSIFNQSLRGENVTYPFSESQAAQIDRLPLTGLVPNHIMLERLPLPDSISNQSLRNDDLAYFSKSFVESAARRDQLPETALVSNQNLGDDYVTYPSESYAARIDRLRKPALGFTQNLRNDDNGGSRLYDQGNNRNDATYQMQGRSFEDNQTKDHSGFVVNGFQQLSIENDERQTSFEENKPLSKMKDRAPELPHLRFGRFRSGMNGSNQPTDLTSQSLKNDLEDIPEFADDVSLRHLNTRDAESSEEEEQRLRRNAADEQITNLINSSSNYDQYKSSSATDFTLDNSQRFNPAVDPLEPSLQMQNFNTFPGPMHRQAYTREPDPQYSAFPFNQSSPTASSFGRKPSISMTEALKTATIFVPQRNRQAMNHHYSQPKVPPSGHNSNMINCPYSQPKQSDSYNMPPLAFQGHGGSNTNRYRNQSLAAMLPQCRNMNPPQSAVNVVSSAYGFGTSSGNSANSRFGYGDVLRSQFNGSNHLPSIQRQNGNSNVWPPQGHNDSCMHSESDIYSLISGHQNQRTPSFGHSQQEEEEEEQPYRGFGYERSSPYYTSLSQQNSRRDPSNDSNQTQQQRWRRNNY